MLRLLIPVLLSGFFLVLSANDAAVTEFLKQKISPAFQVLHIDVADKTSLEGIEGWSGYVVDFTLKEKKSGREINASEVLFSDGRFVSADLHDTQLKTAVKKSFTPSLPKGIYDASHRIVGSEKAKHNIIVFSDPVCPFCMDFVPELIAFVKQHADVVALYYYHLPLTSIHPAAPFLCKAMIAAEEKHIDDLVLKVYGADFDHKEENVQKLLKAFNQQIGTNLALDEVMSEAVTKHLEHDEAMAKALIISGTPTILVDGKKDPLRQKYRQLGAK